MDIQPKAQQSISDDQELAKVLAGVSNQDGNDDNLQFEESPASSTPTPPTPPPAPNGDTDAKTDGNTVPEPTVPQDITIPTPSFAAPPAATSNLDSIKQDALNELRPLVDKLDVSPEEKFDTYLLLLRSTDDRDLIGPAHEAARSIVDESRRAQALLDIIKEIDYLSSPQQQQ